MNKIYEKIESTAVRLNIDAVKNEEKLINLCNHLIICLRRLKTLSQNVMRFQR